MSAALSFRLASDLGPSPDEREEFATKIRSKDAELEELREAKSGAMKPKERQALVLLLSDIRKENEDLKEQAVKQAGQIEDLTKALKDIQEDIEQIRDDFPRLLAEDRRRLKLLEDGPDLSENDTIRSHIDELYTHMEAIGRKQVSFKEASRCLNLSKTRVLQFKTVIALDDRFIIVPSETHKQRKWIRLRKYYKGDNAHQTA